LKHDLVVEKLPAFPKDTLRGSFCNESQGKAGSFSYELDSASEMLWRQAAKLAGNRNPA
jgi:hypothetical protein